MRAAPQAGYECAVLFAFIEAHATMRDDGRLQALNEIRLTESHREMLGRWQLWETVPLAKVDSFLMHYDLMCWELEDWARETLGREGFIDPTSDPEALVL